MDIKIDEDAGSSPPILDEASPEEALFQREAAGRGRIPGNGGR